MAKRLLTVEQRRRLSSRIRRLERPFLELRARGAVDLDALARLHGTDKSSELHGYAALYQKHFASRRPTVRSVLEIGVGGTTSGRGYETTAGGQSLIMWSTYFPNADVVGIDIYAKSISRPRIHFEQGDQSDRRFLDRLIDKYGPFDVVIDDGSHIGRDITTSFSVLWQAVLPGGLYAIEDLATAYDPEYEGGPPGTPGTAIELIKTCVDDTILRASAAFCPTIASIHLYSELVIFEKTISAHDR